MTSELERIKILEGKISQVVDYLNKTIAENEKLKQQVKDLKSENKGLVENEKKVVHLSESVKNYEDEREAIKEKIEELISQIDQLGI
ncbi:MAG: cell division protein ZapB [Candidatus Aminicenantes bacterium]|nr:cell division protein ZapB [Candidatus Aminicenantes bacterium]